jgi:hypothetical protein
MGPSLVSAPLDLDSIVADVAEAIHAVDQRRPVWTSSRTGNAYLPGIGPHPETETVRLFTESLAVAHPGRYRPYALGVPYPSGSRQKCDWTLGDPSSWAIEIKMLRLMGDNGKPNDNMLMHILSPYHVHRSALTDVVKLEQSGFACRRAVLIYGFDYPDLPMEPALQAFECLAKRLSPLSRRHEAALEGLIHPIHQHGRVVAWEINRS